MSGASASVAALNDGHLQRRITHCVLFLLSVVSRTSRVWRHGCYAERGCCSSAEDFILVPCTVIVLNKVQISGR